MITVAHKCELVVLRGNITWTFYSELETTVALSCQHLLNADDIINIPL